MILASRLTSNSFKHILFAVRVRKRSIRYRVTARKSRERYEPNSGSPHRLPIRQVSIEVQGLCTKIQEYNNK